MNCSQLSDLTLPKKEIAIGTDAITNTPYLSAAFGDFAVVNGVLIKYLGTKEDVIIPDGITAIGDHAFKESPHVTSITIPDSVITIGSDISGDRSYYSTRESQLKKLVLGKGVTSIGADAFSGCEKLSTVVFNENLRAIGKEAFALCSSLKTIDLANTSVTELGTGAFSNCFGLSLMLPPCLEIIPRDCFAHSSFDVVSIPKTVKTIETSSFTDTSELIVYDTLDPEAVEAEQWEFDYDSGKVNSPLSCAMLSGRNYSLDYQYNIGWRDYHITVRSAETDEIKYRIFCDGSENGVYHNAHGEKIHYRAIMYSGWGKHASFVFEHYDAFFMKAKNPLTKLEMAFCRLQYPWKLQQSHKAVYEAYLERCLYIERSAKRTAEMLAKKDAVERLKMLAHYGAIDAHNIGWLREQFERFHAENCLDFLNSSILGKDR